MPKATHENIVKVLRKRNCAPVILSTLVSILTGILKGELSELNWTIFTVVLL